MLLAIDTSTDVTGIALFDGAARAEMIWRSGRNQTSELVPAIEWQFRRLGIGMEDICAVAVALGPGSFNGLRVGIATAKGLSVGRTLPCIGIGTLEATAFQHVPCEMLIRPMADAGRGEVVTALYRMEDGGLRALEQACVTTVGQVAAGIAEPTLVCGELRPEWVQRLRERAEDVVSVPSQAGMVRRPAFLAEMGWNRWLAGQIDDPGSLQPIYLRRPAITPPRDPEIRH